MEITVNQKLDKEYYEECYSEWLKFRSKYKKWENKIGVFSILSSVIIYIIDPELIYISGGLIAGGISMIYEFYSSKRKWIKDRLDSRVNNTTVTMTFKDNQVQSIGPFTDVNGSWDFFKDAVASEKGIFLIPENGIMIYFQKKSFDNPEDVNIVLEKVKKGDSSDARL